MKNLKRNIIGTGEAARLLGVSKPTVLAWARAGIIESVAPVGSHNRFKRKELEAMLVNDQEAKPVKLSKPPAKQAAAPSPIGKASLTLPALDWNMILELAFAFFKQYLE